MSEYGDQRLEIEAHNALSYMNHRRQMGSYENKTTAEIIRGIIDSYGFKMEVSDFGVKKEFQVKDFGTDYEYIQHLANLYGKDVYAFGDRVYVGDRINVLNEEAVFEWGKSLIRFEREKNVRELVNEAGISGYDRQMKMIREAMKAEEAGLKIGGGEVWKSKLHKYRNFKVSGNLESAEEAKQLLEGFLRKNSFEYQSGSGEAEGYNRLFPGMTVMIKLNDGDSAEGEYIADMVRHLYDRKEGYRTTFTLKRNTEPGTGKSSSKAEQEQAAKSAAIAEDTEDEEESGYPELQNPRWCNRHGEEIDEALVGDEVTLSVDVYDIPDGEIVTFEIWENDEDNQHDFVEKVKGRVYKGKVEVPWDVKYMADDDDSTSGKELAEKGYTLPEYHFVAKYKDVESDKSPVMEVKEWASFSFNKKQKDILSKYSFHLYTDNFTDKSKIAYNNESIKIEQLPFAKNWNIGV